MSKRKSRRTKSSQGVEKPRAEPVAVGQGARGYCLGAAVLLIVATVLIPGDSVAAALGTGVMLVMLWLVLLVAWLATGLPRPQFEIRVGWTDAAIGVLLLLHSLSAVAVVVTGQGSARPELNMMWQWVSFGVTFFLIRQLVRSRAECRALCAVMIGLAVALSMHGYFQYAYSLPLMRAEYAANPDKVARDNGIDAPAGSPPRKQFESRLSSVEPMATFALTNSLAGYLAPWLVAALGIALATWPKGDAVGWAFLPVHDERKNETEGTRETEETGRNAHPTGIAHALQKLLSTKLTTLEGVGTGAVLIAGCLLLTKSRTAYLATGVGVLLLALYGRPRGWRLDWRIPVFGAAALVLLLVAAIVAGGLDAAVVGEAPKSVLYRVQYWQATAAMIADYPLLGCGPGNFQETYTAYKLPEASETVADPHNFLFEVWATAGTPALVALLAVFGCFVWQLWRATDSEVRRTANEGTEAEDKRSADSIRTVYIGALVGVLFAYPCGWLVGYPLEEVALPLGVRLPAIWLVGLPVAAACVALLHGWVEHGAVPLAALVVALVVLLVNLLAAGGIGFPGVAQSMWVLLALSLCAAEVRQPLTTLPRGPAIMAVLAALLLVAACHFTFYNPVLTGRGELAAGDQLIKERKFGEAESRFRLAARIDPYSAEPWQQLAQLSLGRWRGSREQQQFETFEQAVEEVRRRAPRSNKVHKEIGDWYLAAFRDSGDAALAVKAAESYREAVRLYPNGNLVRAQLAWALYLAGEKAAAAQEAGEALRLDALNPHSEQKLAAQQVFDPPPSGEPPANSPPAPDTSNAEQLMHRLRTAEQSRAGGA
jgi:tetratricopeptide (TPR) repeat protein